MMKYTGKYYMVLSLFLRRHLIEQFGKEVTNKALKGAKPIYKEMLEKCEDIGYDNPMASNIYMCFVFLAIWKAADGAIDYEGYRKVIKDFMTTPPVSKFLGSGDLNNPITLKKGDERMHKMQEWADEHPEYKDKTWDFNFENKHKDGIYYHFTRCPLNDFARKNGFLEILPLCCEIDHYMTEAKHGVLHRDYTLATGGSICDYWIVPDKIANPQ
ncbi:L-2-amino-thiazoline-4-carboxylic acid hydrolase [Pseudobutyrivibrio sp. 49]|uniref:L-2-amino-thiazoline-4-carboxylic acid hydrolase n=1 Tax=Pseudobutyrivibrio sp. 49 TaxID=1855344 RepID=UPI000880A764|nr:L-2-amino-thiazoline-4-carboxylic acid hydrolase [Pseudobutyrivibrio sp. 49]SDI00024.1 L-2-amino-thiazoline-4-carboxylic acid hydrolase [Pseudobutyrivibrio sp. 49]